MHLLARARSPSTDSRSCSARPSSLGRSRSSNRSAFVHGAGLGRRTRQGTTLPTIIIGVVGGFMVGLTSVGAGSLILVLLVHALSHVEQQATRRHRLAQSLPLTFSAALGTLIFGHVELGLTSSIIIGSVSAVIVARCSPLARTATCCAGSSTGVCLVERTEVRGCPHGLAGDYRASRSCSSRSSPTDTGSECATRPRRRQYPKRSRVSSRFCQPGSTETLSSRKQPLGELTARGDADVLE